MKSEESTPSRDLKPSPELFEMIQAAASSLTGFAQLWESIRKKGTKEGFTETELQDLIKPLLKAQLHMSKEQIWYMFNKEKKAIANKEAYDTRRINPPIVQKKELDQQYTQEDLSRDIVKKLIEEKDEPEEPIIPDDEDPKDLEIQFLKEKVAELEDALKKTEMFKPANKLTEEQAKNMTMEAVKQAGMATPIVLTEEMVFDWLARREDKITCFWYPNMGIKLVKPRILENLENSGVKMFKRLYFEV